MTDIAKYPTCPVDVKSLILLWFSGCVPSRFLVVTSYVKLLKTLIPRVCVSPLIYIYILVVASWARTNDPLRITYE
jgi:hypothetical protein